MTDLTFRILQLAYRLKRAHIGSALTAAPILDEIYSRRKPDEPVILSAGHAFLGLAAVLEKHLGHNAAGLLEAHGVHPTKSAADQIWCSTGSLGQGLSVAVGRALADRRRKVWVYITDGECAEGVVYEALAFAGRAKLDNLKIYCGWNHQAAYHQPSVTIQHALNELFRVHWEFDTPTYDIPFLKGQDAHYHVMTDEDWKWTQQAREGERRQCPDCGGQGQHYMAMHSPPILIGCSRCHGSGWTQS